jgi:hypothetical protein
MDTYWARERLRRQQLWCVSTTLGTFLDLYLIRLDLLRSNHTNFAPGLCDWIGIRPSTTMCDLVVDLLLW